VVDRWLVVAVVRIPHIVRVLTVPHLAVVLLLGISWRAVSEHRLDTLRVVWGLGWEDSGVSIFAACLCVERKGMRSREIELSVMRSREKELSVMY